MKISHQSLIQSSASFYLTLASIIQSLAFAFLLDQAFRAVTASDTSVVFWLRIATAFIIIILVWHEYAMGSIAYFWIVDLLDTSIPFLFAISQYMLIHFSNPDESFYSLSQHESWLISIWIFSFITVGAYWNQVKKIRASEGGTEFFAVALKSLKFAVLNVVVFGVIFLCSVLDLAYINELPDTVVPGAVLLFSVCHAVRIHCVWKRRMANLI
jgi:hypothetical protein